MFQIATTYGLAAKYGDVAEFKWQPYFDLPERSTRPENYYVQPDGNNSVLNINYQRNLCIAGFFQRHEYFDHIKDMLINQVFKVPQDWQPNTIGVHVRRGDFRYDPINFPIQPVEYYTKALEELDYKNKEVIFCSDDLPWCRQNFPFAQFRENTKPLDDIFFMANCDAVIMSNSTFSFWGAYLSKRERPVYFPLHWFNKDSGRTGYEICPKTWKGL